MTHARRSSTDREPQAGLSQLDDGELVERCRSGDEAAWKELVCRYERLVYAVPNRYGLDEDSARDVFQEVFAILVAQLPALRNPSGLPKWLMTTARNVCRKWLREAHRESGVAVEPEVMDAAPEFVQMWESQHRLRQALRRLGGRCEELILALYSDRVSTSYEAVARRLGVPVGSIGPTRARCLRKLLDLIESMEGGDT